MRGRVALLAAAALAAATAIAVRAAPTGGVNQALIDSDATPETLSAFGFFTDAPAQVPAKGLKAYILNTALWSDGAEKLRFVSIPAGLEATARPASENGGLLDFPVGSALIKTFAFTENGKRRLIETRLLLHRQSGWVALPYLWNAEQTEARLALAGARVPVTTPSGERISYRVPNKNQCKECHGLNGAVVPIGPKARNLPRAWIDNMIASQKLDRVPDQAATVPEFGRRKDFAAAAVARGYLDVNCGHCHRPGGSASNSGLDLRWEQTDRAALGVMKRPVAAGRGAGHLLYGVVPGKPAASILIHRMKSTEPGVAMPELGKDTVDVHGVAAVERWITEGAK